ncbi:oligoendopeptidase F [Candidatus Woesearchaeota archaeon]|nr:MAG: oligoendopeptidase F [Candidatus Woesearchaeota archaeon]
MVVWNLNDIYDFSQTGTLLKQVKEKAEKFALYRKKLKNLSPKAFVNLLKEFEEITVLSAKISSYADLWLSENTASSERNAHEAKISEALTDIGNTLLFFSIWFKELPEKKAKIYIKSAGKYAYFLKRIRDFQKHSLDEKSEQLIRLKDLTGNETLTRMYDLFTNKFLYDWEGKKVQQAVITKFFSDANAEKRKKAYQLVMKKYGEEETILSELYKGIVNDWRNENVKVRKYESPIAVRHLGNDIPAKAIDSVLAVIRKNTPLFQEYFRLKAKILNIEMSRYHLYAPYQIKQKEYDYETSKKIVLETYKDFSPEFYAMAKKVFDENHVHARLTENKRSGAFCYSITPQITPYVLLNHVNKPRDVSTMAHELGHAVHSLFAHQQTIFTFHAGLPLAETASVFGEMLLFKKLVAKAEKKEKIALLMQKLDDTYATIMRQAYFILFELQAHQMIAEGATVEDLNRAYRKNLNEQFGGAVAVPEEFQHEWKYIPHIFHSPFYCYAYSFGNLLVLALYNKYAKEGKSFIPKYIKILSYGGSKSPYAILKEVGIDITQESFWQEGFNLIKKDVDELKKLVK